MQRPWTKKLAPILWIAIAAGAVYVLVTRLEAFALSDIARAVGDISKTRVVLAVSCCVLAYVLLSVYEVIAVQAVTGKRLVRAASITSWIAHSIGHVIGAALASGGALRYRRYTCSGLSAAQVAAITVQAALPYVLAACWILDVALVMFTPTIASALHVDARIVIAVAVLSLAKDFGWLWIVARRRTLTFRNWSLPLPSLQLTFIQIAVGAAEISLVAAILYLFMPADLGMSLVAFTGIFLLAATVAQVSHVPAGMGVLEAALLVLLPQVPPAELLAAVLCYRAVFELLPLAVGLVLLVHAELSRPRKLVRPVLENEV